MEDLLNKRLADVFRNAPVGVALLRGPEHVYEFTNAVYQRMVGHREVLGRPIRTALPELEGQGIFELLDQVYATGKATRATPIQCRLRMPSRDDSNSGTSNSYTSPCSTRCRTNPVSPS